MPRRNHSACNPLDDPRVEVLRSNWQQIGRFEKGDAIKLLHEHYTLKQLQDPVLPCKEKKLRDFILLSGIPRSKRNLYESYGTKKILSAIRIQRNAAERWTEALKGTPGRKLKNRLHRILIHWCADNIPPDTWDKFLFECLYIPDVSIEIFDVPKHWHKLKPTDDWEQMVAKTKPPGNEHSLQYDWLFAYLEEWLSRWYMRCIPDAGCGIQVFVRARKFLRRRSKRMGLEHTWISDLRSSAFTSLFGLGRRPWYWLGQKAPGTLGILLAWSYPDIYS